MERFKSGLLYVSLLQNKLNKAYCPEGEVKENPILSVIKLIIFPYHENFVIERPEKFGGKVEFKEYLDLEKSFLEKKIHPMDLKNSCAKYLSEILEKIRKRHKNI